MQPQTRSDATEPATRGRRGRLPDAQRAGRYNEIVEVALELIAADPSVTMGEIARATNASKETLYRWFGDRDGVIAALIRLNADRSAQRVTDVLADGGDETRRFADVLTDYAGGLLTLLASPSSLAINRAAISNPALGRILLDEGRYRVGPIVEQYLTRLDRSGLIDLDAVGGSATAFEVLYGLVVSDVQISVLLGDAPPTDDERARRARDAVDRFLRLAAPS